MLAAYQLKIDFSPLNTHLLYRLNPGLVPQVAPMEVQPAPIIGAIFSNGILIGEVAPISLCLLAPACGRWLSGIGRHRIELPTLRAALAGSNLCHYSLGVRESTPRTIRPSPAI